MRQDRLVTIVVPIYNVEKYLEKCLESLVKQTYENLQIVLVNDGSTDSSENICRKFMLEDNRIELINKVNGGLSDARNFGIDVTRGEYLLFVDSDDYLSPQTVEICMKTIEYTNADIVEFAVKKIFESDSDRFETFEFDKNDIQIFNHTEALTNILSYRFKIVAWNKLYKTSLFNSIRYPKGKLHEDEFTTPYLVDNATIYCTVPYSLYAYVQREGSIMNTNFSDRRFDILEAYQERHRYFQEKYGNEYDAILDFGYLSILSNLLEIIPTSHEMTSILKQQKQKQFKKIITGKTSFFIKLKVLFKSLLPNIYNEIIERKNWEK